MQILAVLTTNNELRKDGNVEKSRKSSLLFCIVSCLLISSLVVVSFEISGSIHAGRDIYFNFKPRNCVMVQRKNKKKESMSETVYHAVKEMVYLNRFK